MSILTVKRSGLIWRSLSLTDGDRTTSIRFSPWSDRATIDVEGSEFDARQEFASGNYVLERGDSVIARAHRHGLLGWRAWHEVTCGSSRLALKRTGTFWRGFLLLDGESTVGTLPHLWWFGTRTVDLPAGLAAPAQAFIVWLASVLSRRDHS